MATQDGDVVLDADERTTSARELEEEVADGVVRMVMEIHAEEGTTRVIYPQENGKGMAQVNKRLR